MMKINVLVNREDDQKWLQSILDCFLKVSGANFRFNIYTEEQQLDGTTISYGTNPNLINENVLSIPRINEYQSGIYSNVVTQDLEDNRIANTPIPIFQKTFTPGYTWKGKTLLQHQEDHSCCASLADNNIQLSFDIFYNCFVHLYCLQEQEYEERFYPIHSYVAKLNEKPETYQKPIVNYLFAVLEDMLLLLVDEPHKDKLFKKRKGFSICLTHDVDYIRKTCSLRAKRSSFYLVNGIRHVGKAKLRNALRETAKSLQFFFNPCDYWQFEYIQKLEESYNFKSTFYFYAGILQGRVWGHFKRIIFDPEYNIERNNRLQKKIRELTEKGWEVGLHGSFDSYNSFELLSEEKDKLASISRLPVLSTRQHWLRLSLADTWKVQAQTGIKMDTTLGFNDCPGFRAGIANPFHPYNFAGDSRHQILEVPMVLMDGTLFDYCQMSENQALERSLEILGEVKKFNGCVAINWHQRTPSKDYKWYRVYQEIMSWIKDNKGEGIPICKILDTMDEDENILQRTI